MENIIYLKTYRNEEYVVGDNCERIEEHPLFYDIYDKAEGVIIRIFDPMEVRFEWIAL